MQVIIENPLFALFLIIGLGLLIGEIKVTGINLGSSGVIFVALIAGHLGMSIPKGTGNIGLAIFVYCVGIGAGARFFGALKREGSTLAKLALITILTGGTCTYLLAKWFGLSPAMATGIFAGALTSTPALAAAMESAGTSTNEVVVGYGIAYPLGVIGVVLFVQLIPRLLKVKMDGTEGEEEIEAGPRIVRELIEVTNPNLFGKKIRETSILKIGGCQISRVCRNDQMEPLQYDDEIEEGMLLLVIGTSETIQITSEFIGRTSKKKITIDGENQRQDIVVTNGALAGKTLHSLDVLKNHGVIVTRIKRMDFPFIPSPQTKLERRDLLTVVGPKENLAQFATFVGHRALAYSETSMISLAIGLGLGILLGMVPIPFGEKTIHLGLSGGPLIMALILGHYGKVGGLVGYIPRPTRILLQEMGLVFFLADAGIKGGASMMESIMQEGAVVFGVGAIITLIPLLVGFLTAKYVFKMSIFQNLGGVCGAMTSTPALGAIISKTPRQSPIISYATVYPVAVILMAFLSTLLIQLIH
jgi:putative transport protein